MPPLFYTMRRNSLIAYWFCAALILASTLFYYPKWKQSGTEATLSWDVSGYYLYLPAVFIYKDVKELKWFDGINEKYHPGPGMGQAFKHTSGNYVMKYPLGQALQYLPWFTAAHLIAAPLGYPADGFSAPYQTAIGWGSLLLALIGLWFLRKVLNQYFSDNVTAATLICLVFGSNYLEYAGITGAMTHNWLFTLYSLLIYSTIQFYKKPGFAWAALIGILVGWATITRPTEIIAAIIPMFWGINAWGALKNRFELWIRHFPKMAVSVILAGLMIFMQLAYWKYATGEWIVYSYQDQTFTWFPPHIEDVLWSARAGWLVYSPMMIFAVLGIFMLRKRLPAVFPALFTYCMVALYITSAWDIWWYGGSLGQRAMVQAYPLWAFGLATFIHWAFQEQKTIWTGFLKVLLLALAGGFLYLNIWWTHQAHRGGLFVSEQMTRAYMFKILGKFEREQDWMKLLDTRDEFKGAERNHVKELLWMDFEADTSKIATTERPIAGAKSIVLKNGVEFSPGIPLAFKNGDAPWIRASCRFRCEQRENDIHKMTHFVLRFWKDGKILKDATIRLQRHVNGNEEKAIYFDTKVPKKTFDQVTVYFWNPGSDKTIYLDDLRVESFD